ncbi:uncharacterized protein BO80DRAFT_101496 [Aspergillus ibericus CBS 121593]|uniref:Uncharacterized protein n=1 Tax=Aspergillus ibericus CBS 121593 TaxID=1448316 RepID=A0A395GY51_9EURO|nr:hypothetical protein BO80DRAFT_101496 [Aspergillus ibericus CBS 121593]RAL00542.1 hypothetical protein BO80DRAFT_101496 [Aspergillus ibericus CBS 121593]
MTRHCNHSYGKPQRSLSKLLYREGNMYRHRTETAITATSPLNWIIGRPWISSPRITPIWLPLGKSDIPDPSTTGKLSIEQGYLLMLEGSFCLHLVFTDSILRGHNLQSPVHCLRLAYAPVCLDANTRQQSQQPETGSSPTWEDESCSEDSRCGRVGTPYLSYLYFQSTVNWLKCLATPSPCYHCPSPEQPPTARPNVFLSRIRWYGIDQSVCMLLLLPLSTTSFVEASHSLSCLLHHVIKRLSYNSQRDWETKRAKETWHGRSVNLKALSEGELFRRSRNPYPPPPLPLHPCNGQALHTDSLLSLLNPSHLMHTNSPAYPPEQNKA